ncbi:MAG TPA: DUF3189 family protein [Clostridiales bacterium]|nr:DUF3189 family protein [Clostridiales bacterium]
MKSKQDLKIIYCGYHGLYISALAGYMHILDIKSTQGENEAYLLAWMDSITRTRFFPSGNLFYLGLDKDYNEVYSLGCKNAFGIIEKAQKGVVAIHHNLDGKIHHVDISFLEGRLCRLVLDHTHSSAICQRMALGYLRHYARRQMEKILKRVLLVKEALKDGGLS